MWKEDFLGRFLELVGRHRSILDIAFAGHTHMDDYRVARVAGAPGLLCKIVPSVSPVFGNNPAFQVYQFEEESGALAGWQTYSLDLATSGGQSPTSAWRREYDARDAYRLTAIDAETVAALFVRIRDNSAGREADAYRRFFRVGAGPIPVVHLPIYACAVLDPYYAGYSACVSAHNLPVPREMRSPARLRRRAGGLGDPKR